MIRRFFLFIGCLAFSACVPSVQQSTGTPQAWFDMPLPETVFYPPNPCQVVAHGASPNGIALFELSINGAVAASIPHAVEVETLATLHYSCSLLQLGRNLLEVRVYDTSGNWSEYAETTVILAGMDARSPDPTMTATFIPGIPRSVFTPSGISTLPATFTPTLPPVATRKPSTSTPTLVMPTLRPTDIPTLTPTATYTAAPACSSYTDERTCIANGCLWVAIPGTVPIYECRNP